MASIQLIKGSDGSGNAAIATVQTTRSPGSSTIIVDTVVGINPTGFTGSMGTPHTFTDPITSETITVISEASAVDFAGHVDGSNLEIDTIAPGYTDAGSAVGDIVIIRPTTQWSDNVAETLEVSHNDDGTLQRAAIDVASDGEAVGLLANIRTYTAGATWTKPSGLKFIVVKAKGAGGGGGGVGTTSGIGQAGGGGEGEEVISKILTGSLGATEAVVVGAGGAGGVGNNTGATGADTTLGTTIVVAKGGAGGNGSTGISKMQVGGAGGTGGTGDLKIAGIRGNGAQNDGSNFVSGIGGGKGGGDLVNSAGAGNAAVANSGGGGGGAQDTGTTSRTGGAGGSGYMIIEEYF